ncbi:hypothetical protein BD289DRAFT_454518 [Coniella lustricola]|uniref:PCI domain-containing protein n=1 Tax=Coniella lustricola TaxID=2025994 RepID=A0A2T3A355_9PEZI|nr:hypothetical protein BD289DRAFT_454518 [Coniella lustricola]
MSLSPVGQSRQVSLRVTIDSWLSPDKPASPDLTASTHQLTCNPQPFLALTKSATSPRAAVDLINRATSAPNTYIFTELLNAPNIAVLASSSEPEHRAWHSHLEIFSHGLYSSYYNNSSSSSSATTENTNLPPLNPAQQLKLRQLSLLTLSRDKSQLSYLSLMRHLALSTPRELEDVVISAVYAGLLSAKLNPLRQEVQVSSVAPLRDVRPASIAGIVNTLQEWSARCDATLAELEASVSAIRAEAARAAEEKRESERVIAAAIAAEEKGGSGGGSGGGSAGDNGVGAAGSNSRHKQKKGYGHAAVANLKSQIVSGGGSGVAGSGSKRGSEKLMESTTGTEEDDEAMDVDDDGEVPGQKRASRRKL